jgi:hypothetical protein
MTEDPTAQTETSPGSIDIGWIRDFRRQLRLMPKGLLTGGERHVILTLADAISVRRDDPRRGTWAISIARLASDSGACKRLAARAIDKGRLLGIVRQLTRGHNGFGDRSKARVSVYTLELPDIAKRLHPDIWRGENIGGVSKMHKIKTTQNKNSDVASKNALSGKSLESARHASSEKPLESAPPCILNESAPPCILDRPESHQGRLLGAPTGGVVITAARETVDLSPAASPSQTGAPLDAPEGLEQYDEDDVIYVEDDHHAAESSSRDRDLATETSSATEEIGAAAGTPAAAARSPANRAPVDVSDASATPVAGCDDEVPDDAYFEMLASMEQEAEDTVADLTEDDLARLAAEYDARVAATTIE